MKTWGIIIGVILLLFLLFSPVVAISKSDLVSQYKTDAVVKPIGPVIEPTSVPTMAPTSSPSASGTPESYVYQLQWGSEGTGDGQFTYPRGLAVDGLGNVYVVEWGYPEGDGNHRVQKFSSDGTFITKWGSVGTGDGQFKHPNGIAVDGSGNVYVADGGNHRIQKFTSTGVFITKWGSEGTGDCQFCTPDGVAVDASGNVYVTNYGEVSIRGSVNSPNASECWANTQRIQKFSSDGTFITAWGSYGSGIGQFKYPMGIAVDASGNVYVADSGNNRIQKFSSDGTFITTWGSEGSGDSQFMYPEGVAVDLLGNVYVAEWGQPDGGHRIQKFTSTGVFLTKWGSFGTGDGQFHSPDGVAVDASGNVYVAEFAGNRIQRFGTESSVPTRVPTTILPTKVPTAVPTPAPSGTGSLSISSSPVGALVHLDGVFKGTTPIAIPGVSPGSHQVRLSKVGYLEYTAGVTVVSGKANTVTAALIPSEGIAPSSLPTRIPPEVPTKWPILPDIYAKPKVPGTTSYEADLPSTCCGNGSRIRGEIEPQPTPTFGFLEVLSDPPGARVSIDVNPWTGEGTFIGITPMTVRVETGTHRLKLTKAGYSGAKYRTPVCGYDAIEVTVTEGETARVSAVLIPGNDISKVRLIV